MRSLSPPPGAILSRPGGCGPWPVPARSGTRPWRLHELLARIAWGEVARRGRRLRITGPELDDLACQAAADALLAITGKLGQFRLGISRSPA